MIEGKVYSAGFYHDAVPMLVISMKKEDLAASIPCAGETRPVVNFRIASHEYRARLRSTQKMKDVRICSDLTTHDGTPVRLADVLRERGIGRNMKVVLRIEGDRVELLHSLD